MLQEEFIEEMDESAIEEELCFGGDPTTITTICSTRCAATCNPPTCAF